MEMFFFNSKHLLIYLLIGYDDYIHTFFLLFLWFIVINSS